MHTAMHKEQMTIPNKKTEDIPKELEIDLFHLINEQLLNEGIISDDIFKKVKADIDRL